MLGETHYAMDGMLKILEGLRIFRRVRRVKHRGFRRYEGSAKEICASILNDCWNGTYFRTSAGHFTEFYSRDFGFCTESLLKLGYRREVLSTLDYALRIFSKHKRVATTITPGGKPVDIYMYAPDSLALLMRSLRLAKAKSIVSENRQFLEDMTQDFSERVIDSSTGLVRKDSFFSSVKDNALRTSSCYDNVMVGMLKESLRILGLSNPFKSFNYKKIVTENFWKDTHFIDDLSGKEFLSGDANLFPYWSGLITSQRMFRLSSGQIRRRGLDRPFPLRYYHKKDKDQKMLIVELFAKNYERDVIWMHLGMLYLETVKRYDTVSFRRYLALYTRLIEKYKNFLEVFTPDGKPYMGPFYCSDEGMLWASIYLGMAK
mgnify:CR=1 FL=1